MINDREVTLRAEIAELSADILILEDMGHRLNAYLVAAMRIDRVVEELTAAREARSDILTRIVSEAQ